jgi:hypothetical protein
MKRKKVLLKGVLKRFLNEKGLNEIVMIVKKLEEKCNIG